MTYACSIEPYYIHAFSWRVEGLGDIMMIPAA